MTMWMQLIFIIIAFSGPFVTAFLTIKRRTKYVIALNLITLSLIMLINGSLIEAYGAGGWVMAVTIGYVPQLLALLYFIFWVRHENSL
jgi:hypothetical protein